MNHKAIITLAATTLLIGACSLTPAYETPSVPLPAQWSQPVTDAAAAPAPAWWQAYDSAELDELIKQALAANHDLAAAVARIAEARASTGIARAALWPTLSASASASHSRRSGDDQAGTDSSSGDDGRAGLSINYELDLFGANAASANAAKARLAATRYAGDEVALVLQADVTSTWLQALALQDRLALARENLTAAQELLRLVQVRYDNGAVGALDVAQQRTTLLNIQAQIPALEQSLVETRNALAVLLGRSPGDLPPSTARLADLRLPAIDAGQPATLLLRRPDIRGAEAGLIAANADIGAARAALLPSLNLSASTTALGLLDGGASTLSSVAASLAQTLFAGGRLRSQLALSEATRTELVERYAQTVLVSQQEVENGLSAVQTGEQREQLLAQTAEQAREAYRLATIRYDSGAEDLLTVLDSLRSRLSADDSLVQARLARYQTSVDLVRALGGGWSVPPPT